MTGTAGPILVGPAQYHRRVSRHDVFSDLVGQDEPVETLRRAASAHGADLLDCWMAGDILDDVEAGHRAGCRAILVDTGGETEWKPGPLRWPDHAVTSLAEAAERILASDRSPRPRSESA